MVATDEGNAGGKGGQGRRGSERGFVLVSPSLSWA